MRCRRKNGRGFSTRRWRRSQSTNTKRRPQTTSPLRRESPRGCCSTISTTRRSCISICWSMQTRRCAGLPKRPTCGRRQISLRCWKKGRGQRRGFWSKTPICWTLRSAPSTPPRRRFPRRWPPLTSRRWALRFRTISAISTFLNSGRVRTRPTCSACSPG